MKYLIVGLGNVGEKYALTRHNVAWLIFDQMLESAHWEYDKYADAQVYREGDCIYAKPQTMMNVSGHSAQALALKYEILPERIIVLHDDLDILVGTFKIAFNRGDAGNNGIKSIHALLGTRSIIRLRIGILQEYEGRLIKPPVLGVFNESERNLLPSLAQDIKAAIRLIVQYGHEKAMNEYN